MEFHLDLPITPFSHPISYQHKLLFIGSCFAENIGDLMRYHKFNVLVNPHGIIYNPISISSALSAIIENKVVLEEELFYANECWNSWDFHSRFSDYTKSSCLAGINGSIRSASSFLKETNWLFITFGSAFVYRHNSTGNRVSNCHKVNQNQFTKELLSIEEIVNNYTLLLNKLKAVNPALQIVFSVSPVRYIRDGMVENNQSKARLLEATHQLVQQHNHTMYFPAYELVIDDLRDYRFYKSDLVHPNEQAIDYVFEKLRHAGFNDETKRLFEKIKDIVSAKKHKPFNTNSELYRKFQNTYLNRSKSVQETYPFLNFEEEIKAFSGL